MAKQRFRVPHHVNNPLFAPLIGKLSTYALNKLHEQLLISRQRGFITTCNDAYTRVMGLPCAHDLRKLTESGQSVLPEHVYRHWYFDPQQAPTLLPVVLGPQIQNPLPTRTGGRPRGGATGTRLHLSQFAIVTRSRQLRKEERIQALSEPGERAESVFPLFFPMFYQKVHVSSIYKESIAYIPYLTRKIIPEWP